MEKIDISNVLENVKKENELLSKQCYVDDGYIVLNVRYEYEIALERCDTHEKILDWVMHLSCKNWFTMRLMKRFIIIANEELKKE